MWKNVRHTIRRHKFTPLWDLKNPSAKRFLAEQRQDSKLTWVLSSVALLHSWGISFSLTSRYVSIFLSVWAFRSQYVGCIKSRIHLGDFSAMGLSGASHPSAFSPAGSFDLTHTGNFPQDIIHLVVSFGGRWIEYLMSFWYFKGAMERFSLCTFIFSMLWPDSWSDSSDLVLIFV